MKLATTTGDFQSFQNRISSPAAICEALVLVAECGFKYIDVNFGSCVFEGSPLCSDNWRDWAEDIKKTGERLGLTFVQAHSSDSVYGKGEKREYLTSMIKRELEICEILGIPGMVVHAIYTQGGTREDFIEKNVEFYSELLETAQKTGVTVYTENTCTNNCPSYYIFDAEDFIALDNALGKPELFGFCLDVGHAHIQGIDQYKAIITMGNRLKAVHIHDNPSHCDLHMQPFSGNCNYDAILMGLKDAGYKGYFTLEALSIPAPGSLWGKKKFEKNGVVYDKLYDLPLEFKLRSERLMHDIAVHMLKAYDCYEE